MRTEARGNAQDLCTEHADGSSTKHSAPQLLIQTHKVLHNSYQFLVRNTGLHVAQLKAQMPEGISPGTLYGRREVDISCHLRAEFKLKDHTCELLGEHILLLLYIDS